MSTSKRQYVPSSSVVPGELRVVATPIGHLSDASPRMREALATADVILAEDTRRALELMRGLGIDAKRIERFDAQTEHAKGALEATIRRIESGQRVALISDAGTPAISDPGARLVRYAREKGAAVTVIPGPSAFSAFLSASGFLSSRCEFQGFFPREKNERDRLIGRLCVERRALLEGESKTWFWFESPHRIASSLKEISDAFPEDYACAAKELTKIHERFFIGASDDVAHSVRHHTEKEGERGEWVFGIELKSPGMVPTAIEESNWYKALECCLESGGSVSSAVRAVCQKFGVKKNEIYEIALEMAKKQ